MRANNRLAGFIGDLRAQVGAAQLGVARLDEIIDAYGADAVRGRGRLDDRRRPPALLGGDRGVARRHLRGRRVRRLRSGRATRDIHVHVAITVDGDQLIVDFAGSDERPEIQAWSTFGNTRGYTIAQLA